MMTFVDAAQSCARGGVQWDRKVSYTSVPGIRNQGGAGRAVMKNGLWQEHAGKPWRKDGLNGRRTGKSITVGMVTGAHPDSARFRKWERRHLVSKCCLASVRARVWITRTHINVAWHGYPICNVSTRETVKDPVLGNKYRVTEEDAVSTYPEVSTYASHMHPHTCEHAHT